MVTTLIILSNLHSYIEYSRAAPRHLGMLHYFSTVKSKLKLPIGCSTELQKCLSVDISSSSNIKEGFYINYNPHKIPQMQNCLIVTPHEAC